MVLVDDAWTSWTRHRKREKEKIMRSNLLVDRETCHLCADRVYRIQLETVNVEHRKCHQNSLLGAHCM